MSGTPLLIFKEGLGVVVRITYFSPARSLASVSHRMALTFFQVYLYFYRPSSLLRRFLDKKAAKPEGSESMTTFKNNN